MHVVIRHIQATRDAIAEQERENQTIEAEQKTSQKKDPSKKKDKAPPISSSTNSAKDEKHTKESGWQASFHSLLRLCCTNQFVGCHELSSPKHC